ncbi:glucose/arabinose dehydrogenase [Microterricola gilva]|uniref:Glucose/arabinose dehydrogenase n=1 Tax=Microterricola gilva TaxID=393267 RepID=A0A4Q8AI97_9MICO|nr:PQQ-dependent sugar dehydrogenase [Microterricola gilva]RZU64094.1 glucose/arabinose dehydrogenase [Microterricola gilva]
MHGRGRQGLVAALGALVLSVAALTGCTATVPERAPSPAPSSPAPRPTASAPASAQPVLVPVQPSGEPGAVAGGLDAPWSILRMTAAGVGAAGDAASGAEPAVTTADGTVIPDGTTLLSERDTGDILELLGDGSTRVVGTVDGVAHGGEGGLLGLAARSVGAALAPGAGAGTATQPPAASGTWVYAYFTSDSDNRIVRMPLQGAAGALALGAAEPVASGIPRASNHDGGRIAFGPDGMLYATAGDAGDSANAQNVDSLGGKILRMTPSGTVPDGNPFGTLVWSIGHRNPQGIGWDSRGRLWASEFGQNTWDELNLITPGANYGWPVVEGAAGDPSFVDPVLQWSTSDASPSGLAVISDTVFIAALRGERIWRWVPDAGQAPTALFTGEFGRIRDVAAGPDGTLWFLSNNTDGRGDPAVGDDRLWQVALVPAGG